MRGNHRYHQASKSRKVKAAVHLGCSDTSNEGRQAWSSHVRRLSNAQRRFEENMRSQTIGGGSVK